MTNRQYLELLFDRRGLLAPSPSSSVSFLFALHEAKMSAGATKPTNKPSAPAQKDQSEFYSFRCTSSIAFSKLLVGETIVTTTSVFKLPDSLKPFVTTQKRGQSSQSVTISTVLPPSFYNDRATKDIIIRIRNSNIDDG